MITGKDEISLQALELLRKGKRVKDLPSILNISIDQAKRLSRYFNLINQVKEHLDNESVHKIRLLGLKSLYLSPLIKNNDYVGLKEVLTVVDEQTKRDDIPLLIQALHQKRERLKKSEQNIIKQINSLEKKEYELSQLENEIEEKINLIMEQNEFIKKYPSSVQKFLLQHLGLFEGNLVLAKRLDSNWQRKLKKKGIIRYSEDSYVWYIENLDLLAEDYIKRKNRKNPYPVEWDYEREVKRNHQFGVPSSSRYQLPTGLSEDLQTSLKNIIDEKKRIESEKLRIKQELEQLKKSTPQSFIESVKVTNMLSPKEIEQHGKLQDMALKWLYNQNYIVASEVILPNGKRADVIGYNKEGYIIIIEVKVSRNDFLQDQKWPHYLEYANEFFFLLNDAALSAYNKGNYKDIGLLIKESQGIKIQVPSSVRTKILDQESVIWSINKQLTKKYVFGF